jgi:chemotaxis protein MotB
MAGRKRRYAEEHEEHEEGSERWLVTYADMVTLLMVLFIIMFAMSTVDTKKYQELKNGLADGFGHSINILNGANPQNDDTGAVKPEDTPFGAMVQNLTASQKSEVQRVVTQTQAAQAERATASAQAEVDNLTKVWSEINDALRKKGLGDDVRAKIDTRGLVISLVSRHVVFEPNLATLTLRGQRILNTMAPVLHELTEPIEIDGHTNQVKVKPKYYPTDWDLSSARAITALRWLNEHGGLPARRLSATGFGHTKPLIDPKKAGSQEINKRVDIIVLSQVPAATRERFNQIQNSLISTTSTSGVTP